MHDQRAPGKIHVGLSAGPFDAAVAIADTGGVTGVIAQERLTRVRGAGLPPRGPQDTLDLLLRHRGRSKADVVDWSVTPPGGQLIEAAARVVPGHLASAATAYLTSPFSDALVVVCDRQPPFVSAWRGHEAAIDPLDVPWRGEGFAGLLTRCASWLGFSGEGAHARFEALARLAPDAVATGLDELVELGEDEILVDGRFESAVARQLSAAGTDIDSRAGIASALQKTVGRVLYEWLLRIGRRTGCTRVALGGELFYLSSFNTMVAESGVFDSVFVPVDPGDAGRAVGAALIGVGCRVPAASPFLGPDFAPADVKAVLDNCKLQYSWESDEGAISVAARALADGRLVGWFEGPMEWGRRALGGRSILAPPLAPYALENLNRFLKRREPWRGYAMSGTAEAVAEHFSGPPDSPFMQFEYRAREPRRFETAMPRPKALTRLHTVDALSAPPRFGRLLSRFTEMTGCPFLFNTSFNGFHEPIVCDPRDAVRVFYGTGLDLLVMGQFVLTK